MKKLKICVLLGMGIIMATSIFTGCSVDEVGLINAFQKSETITSEKTYTKMSVNVSATNLSNEEEATFDTVQPLINSSTISVSSEINENQDKTISKDEEDIRMNLAGMPIKMRAWANEDLTGATPVVNEIVKMPQILTSKLPTQFQGKDYMVMNSADMNNISGTSQINYSKLLTFSKQFQPELLSFISKYAAQFNPDTTYITEVGSSSYLEDSKSQEEDIYELKLTDASLKDLMHYTLTNLASNTDAIKLVKDYVSGIASVYGIKDTTELDSMTNNLPQELATLNQTLSTIDNLKILGQNGIKIRYTTNTDGYIVNEKGNEQFVVDLPSIIKLAEGSQVSTSSANDPTGIYTINLDFNTDITNINGNVLIEAPQVDSTNSFNYTDLVKAVSSQPMNNQASPQLMIKAGSKLH
jgi:hypothetical protein